MQFATTAVTVPQLTWNLLLAIVSILILVPVVKRKSHVTQYLVEMAVAATTKQLVPIPAIVLEDIKEITVKSMQAPTPAPSILISSVHNV